MLERWTEVITTTCRCGEPIEVPRASADRALCDRCAGEEAAQAPPAVPLRPLAERIAAAGVLPRYRGCRRASWDPARAPWPRGVDAWAEGGWQREPFLLLWGLTGNGKTHVATALLLDRLEAGEGGLWRNGSELVERLKADLEQDTGELERVIAAPLLVFDELAADESAWTLREDGRFAWSRDRLRMVIEGRSARLAPTVFTTNRPPSWLMQTNAPLASRVLSGAVLEVTGPDQRLAKRRPV
ncbi:MAG TPA: hypothetical protein VF017_15440 [Thermoanaerobaculia bacterium]|nr:hypothetical protein [Thermoanaerobaculia bacterium]